MAAEDICLRDIESKNDILFATAHYYDESLYIGTNDVHLQFVKEMIKPNSFHLDVHQRKKLQKFLNQCWPEDK